VTDRDALLAAIVAEPREETRWLVLADWLEEFDDPRRAELLRLHRKLIATCCEPDAHPERAAWQSRMVELLVAGVRPCVPQETLTLPGGVPMTFSFIPPGAFLMGSEKGYDDGQRPVHRVELPRGFFMGIYPVTQAQWKAVMGTEPSEFKGLQRPVEEVSWDDCRDFCEKLSGRAARAIDLPTEAEWEYACRAGTRTEYHFGERVTTDLVNFDGRLDWEFAPAGVFRRQTTDVDSFPPNAWGLCDVHGNVWEWCADWYSPYPALPWQDNLNLSSDFAETMRNSRGGAWVCEPTECRSAFRGLFSRDETASSVGFRVCLRLT
jgi:uncharacterized protein (TIGR02996 family)